VSALDDLMQTRTLETSLVKQANWRTYEGMSGEIAALLHSSTPMVQDALLRTCITHNLRPDVIGVIRDFLVTLGVKMGELEEEL